MSILFDKSLETVFNEQAFDEAFNAYKEQQRGLGTYRIYVYFEYRRSSHWNSPCFIMVTRSNKDMSLDMDSPPLFLRRGKGRRRMWKGSYRRRSLSNT